MNISNLVTGGAISYTSTGGLYGGMNVDWSKVPTKDYNSPPTSDIRSMVRNNARLYADATNDDERARLKKEADTLFHKYVSQAAPDRKKLLAGAQTAIKVYEGSSPLKINIRRSKNSIDYLIEAQNKKLKTEISFEGGSVVAEADGRYTVKLGGEDAISITSTGIKFIPSGAELTAQKEIVDFWNSTCSAKTAENQARGFCNGGMDIKV
jgi:hypothetical protein